MSKEVYCETCKKEVIIPHHHGRHSYDKAGNRFCEDGQYCIIDYPIEVNI